MYNHLLYFSYWIVNAVVLYVFSIWFGGDVVLGNWRFGALESAIYSGFWVTFLLWSFWDFAIAKGVKFDSALVTLGYFWSANIFAFWLVSRFSEFAGFGIASYLWAIAIALFAYIVQRLTRRFVVGRKAA